jgi:NADPH:quinone reductase-like Zn-dependent oxidoreductase
MKAVIYNKKNPNGKLELSEIEKPVPQKNEILVQVYSSSINAADYRLIKMGFPPKKKILGADIAGVVEAVGEDVHNFKPGDEVISELSNFGFGGFAEYVAAPAKAFVFKPPGISFEEGAALPLAGVTALQGLRTIGNIQPGQKVLLVGSSGGVGTFAIQIAKYFGAIVTGVCSSRNREQAQLLGVDRVIDYSKEHFSKDVGVYDLIFALNGDYPLSVYKNCLNPSGKFVLIGGSLSQIFKTIFLGKFLSLGSKKMVNLFAKSTQQDLEYLVNLVKERKIKPVIEKIYSLENTPEAMRYAAEGHASAKIIIKLR